MMQEQLVSFETSKLAKNKGYSIPYWGKDKYYTSRGELVNVRKLSEFGILESSHAPTQSLLQSWLRDVHNIIVCVFLDYNPGTNDYKYISSIDLFKNKLLQKNKNITEDYHSKDSINYESAFEESLCEALKLIK